MLRVGYLSRLGSDTEAVLGVEGGIRQTHDLQHIHLCSE